MSFAPTRKALLAAIGLAMACSVVAPASSQGADPRRGRPIQFGSAQSSNVSTNFNNLAGKQDGLNPYQQAPGRELPRYGINSMDAIMVPLQPQRSPVQSKRAKDLLEQRKNWSLNSDELMASPEEEETIEKLRGSAKTEEEAELLRLSPTERLFLKLQEKEREEAALKRKKEEQKEKDAKEMEESELEKSAEDDWGQGRDEFSQHDRQHTESGAQDPGRLGQSSDFTTRFFSNQSADWSESKDLFGGTHTKNVHDNAAKKARRDEFRAILGLPPQQDVISQLFKSPASPTTPAVPSWDAARSPLLPSFPKTTTLTPEPSRGGLDSQLGFVSQFPGAGLSGAAVGLPSLTPTLPAPPQPKAVPPTPNFMAPKRAF